jgi:hypothetical protein
MPAPQIKAPSVPDFALALHIADRERRRGDLDAALGIYRVVLSQCPDYAQGWVELSRVLFALRQWPAAWRAFEYRTQAREGRETPALVARVGLADKPRMRAGAKPGRLAVLSEGGLGDVIQFSRFVEPMMASGVDVRLVAPRRLLPLLRTLDPAPSLACEDEADAGDGCDAWAPIMDLPGLLDLHEPDLAAHTPTLRAEPARVERWRAWLSARRGDRRGPVIAMVWRGATDNAAASERSARLADFAPLAAIPGATLLCLQKDATADEIRASGFASHILRPGPDFDEDGAFLDSAALLMAADRLVTIDTAMAHLAGALARPCDLLLGQDPDWRWLDMAPANVWSPTIRIARCAGTETYADLAGRCVGASAQPQDHAPLAPEALASVA